MSVSDGLYCQVLFWLASGPTQPPRDCPAVFGEWLIAFDCSLLSIRMEINIHLEQNPQYDTINRAV
jgi:hypothetical protein